MSSRVSPDALRPPVTSATRASLQIAAFAAVQAVLIIALAPVTPHLAAWSPPVYALVVGVQTPLIFAARRFTRLRFAGTLAAAITGLLCGPFASIGWLVAVPLVAAGIVFDVVLGVAERRGWPVWKDAVIGGTLVGTTLFVISLPVFSTDHLVPGLLVAVLAARIVASVIGVALASRIVTLLARAGVRAARY